MREPLVSSLAPQSRSSLEHDTYGSLRRLPPWWGLWLLGAWCTLLNWFFFLCNELQFLASTTLSLRNLVISWSSVVSPPPFLKEERSHVDEFAFRCDGEMGRLLLNLSTKDVSWNLDKIDIIRILQHVNIQIEI